VLIEDPYALEVARELGLTFEQLRAECRSRGHSVASANDRLPLTLADWLKRDLPTKPDVSGERLAKEAKSEGDDDAGQQWARAVARARSLSDAASYQGPKYNRRYPPPPMIRAALDHVVVPRRSRSNKRPADSWSVEECDRAERVAGAFAAVWLSHDWLKVAQGERPDLAAALSAAGVTAAEAGLRLNRHGYEDRTCRSLMAQVVAGLPIERAVQTTERFRLRRAGA
jgi:hypothetical protein